MKKDKSGKIIASLTEVKNKTGDIFALVDQFGAVYLTSYNKIRYRIEKIGVESLITDMSQYDSKPEPTKSAEPVKQEATPTVDSSNKMDRLFIAGLKMLDAKIEKDFLLKIVKPLI